MNSPTNDMRADLDYWQSMWDEMESGEVHPPAQSPNPQVDPGAPNTAQDVYYDFLDAEHGEDPELLQEDTSQNPVYPDSQGPDHATTAAVWVTEDLVKEIEELKDKLFKVENKMAAQMGGGEKWVEKAHNPDHGKLMSEIESLKKRIEKVSSNLGVKDEPSPWKTT
jgi:hypothetical protein